MLIDLIYKACEKPAFVIHGVRKIVQGLYYEHHGPIHAQDILTELGYKPVKVTRLMNLYYNAEEVKKAKEKLKQREGEEHSSVSVLTRNMAKTHPASQGWCIQNITISESYHRKKRTVTADIFYRSTELIQKFGADLSLINNYYEALEVQPEITRFYFSNAYVSAVFFPLLFQFTDGPKLLAHIKQHDDRFHYLACKAISRYLDPVNRYTYQAQAKQWERARTLDRKSIDDYLLQEIGDYHKFNMPSSKSSMPERLREKRGRPPKKPIQWKKSRGIIKVDWTTMPKKRFKQRYEPSDGDFYPDERNYDPFHSFFFG